MNTIEEFNTKFRRARNAGTPLISITCADPEATMQRVQSRYPDTPLIQWDLIDGWRCRNKQGQDAIDEALNKVQASQLQTINPTESLKLALNLAVQDFPYPSAIVFMMNTHHFIEKPDFLQALWNLRDQFKAEMCTLVLLGPELSLPAQIRDDIFILDEPLPSDAELMKIVQEVSTTAQAGFVDDEAAVNALRGLAAFPAEQSTAMNFFRDSDQKIKLDIAGLWDRKRKLISSTPGLRVYEGKETFKDIGGCDQIKQFLSGVINGREAPNVVVFMDEIEKSFAGATSGNDTSGVAQDQLGGILTHMEDYESSGNIFYGPPGAAKSAMAKAFGNESGIPTIMLDLGGLKGSLVGKSEQQLRQALKVINAVGGGKAYFIATCNKIVDLPPELRRRFTEGIFFFDLPTEEERQKIWELYFAKYNLTKNSIMDVMNCPGFDDGWTGAEIRNCVRLAYRQCTTIAEAAKYIVPVSKSSGDQITLLRKQASGAYLSASHEGLYKYEDDAPLTPKSQTRRALHVE